MPSEVKHTVDTGHQRPLTTPPKTRVNVVNGGKRDNDNGHPLPPKARNSKRPGGAR